MRLPIWSLALALLALTVVGEARAELPSLSWRAPSGCPHERDVAGALERAAEPDARWSVRSIDARVEATDTGFSMALALETDERVHEKQLSAKRCSTFVELLLLELGFAALPVVPAVEAPPAEPVPIVWGLRASGALGTGPVPRPAPGVALALALNRRRLRAELGASYFFSRSARYEAQAHVGARFQSVAGELRACYLLPVRRVELPFCGGSELGALRGAGFGADAPATAWRLWASLFVAPALHFPLAGPVSGWLELAGSVLVHRPRFGVVNLPTLYRPDLLALRGVIGLAFALD